MARMTDVPKYTIDPGYDYRLMKDGPRGEYEAVPDAPPFSELTLCRRAIDKPAAKVEEKAPASPNPEKESKKKAKKGAS